MAIRRTGVVGLALSLTLAWGLASPAAGGDLKTTIVGSTGGIIKVEYEIEKKGNVRELEIEHVKNLPFNGSKTVLITIASTVSGANTFATVTLPVQSVNIQKGKFKLNIRQTGTPNVTGTATNLFGVGSGTLRVTVTIGGTDVFGPAAL